MRELLKQVEEPIKQKSFAIKPKAPKLIPGDEQAKSRYIPAALRRATISNGQCQYPNCNKPSDHIHHPERFAKVKNHEHLVALCTDHHEFMHNGLIDNETQQNPTMNIHKIPDHIDLLYCKYRR